MHFITFSYTDSEGYGRYSNRLVSTLQRFGEDVTPLFPEHACMPSWMKKQVGIVRPEFTISCLPPYLLQKAPSGGRHWLITMTEGSKCPDGWAESVNESDVERVVVPCEHNAQVFREGGVTKPIHVIHGGTDPKEFPLITERPNRPYTFLALGDRGARKGWTEVYSAFFKAFPTQADVRLIVKARPGSNELIDVLSKLPLDERVTMLNQDMDMREVYRMADCFAIPSRCEGWGMPHREAAMMGLPVITQCYSGLDDGHTDKWSIPLKRGKLEDIPTRFKHIAGQWLGADIDELAAVMREVYSNPGVFQYFGKQAARWLRDNQTWEISASKLLNLMKEYA